MGHKRDAAGRHAHVVALLSGEADVDRRIRDSISRIDPDAIVTSDVDALVATLDGGRADLIVCPDPEAAEALHREIRQRAGGQGGAILLALVRGPALPDLSHPAYRHFLAWPFRAETLTALARALLEHAPAPGAHAGPAVHVRAPARFSARPLYTEAVGVAREAFERAREGSLPDTGRVRVTAERLHTSLLQSNLLLNRALEPYKRFDIPTHCANVAIIAGRVALGLDLPLERTLRTIQAGLLHDLGMARLPDAILHKEGRLTDEERLEMERHPILGQALAAKLGSDFEWLGRAIAQEHERIGGQGYPAGLAGDAIDEIARILAVADVFEAYSHARNHRSPFTVFEALERVVELREDNFDPHVVDALSTQISAFPPDSYVRLSSGAIGRVVATNPRNIMRPTIEILWNEDWRPVEPRILSLDEAPDVAIERPLHESEVPIT